MPPPGMDSDSPPPTPEPDAPCSVVHQPAAAERDRVERAERDYVRPDDPDKMAAARELWAKMDEEHDPTIDTERHAVQRLAERKDGDDPGAVVYFGEGHDPDTPEGNAKQ